MRKFLIAIAILVLIPVIALGFLAVYLVKHAPAGHHVITPTPTVEVQSTPTAQPKPTLRASSPPMGSKGEDIETQRLESVYKNVAPSVVYIAVEFPGAAGSGSGFVWDKDGYIVTNNHVVYEGGEATKVIVLFKDGLEAKAEIVGRDPYSDLAVIHVDVPKDELHPVALGDSSKLLVGQRVEAIGNPYGLEQGWTMTEGIVSALGRTIRAGETRFRIPRVIQTDAAINPGNSGGPLLDDMGRVIGVNSAIASVVRANAGIGFAIPINLVKRIVPALISKGHFDHPWIGISGHTLTSEEAKAMGLPIKQRGALVLQVLSGSPADKAGLKGSSREVEIWGEKDLVGGDVIIAVDGRPVKSFDDLLVYLEYNKSPGDTVTLTVLRDGKRKEIELTLGKRPEAGQ